jgi:hypothetical protein
MFHHRLSFGVAFAVTLAGCSGSGAIGTSPVLLSPATTALPASAIPPSFACLPKIEQTDARAPHIAYASACSVAKAQEAAALQKLAVAMMVSSGKGFTEYCTGTPVAYDPKTHVGFVVTAAHCVVGGDKAAGAEVAAANIETFDPGQNRAEIYQGDPGIVRSAAVLTAKMMAVYVPSQYCKAPAFSTDGDGCESPSEQNGDVAVLKVQTKGNTTLGVLPSLRIANAEQALAHGTLVMALGYGLNTSATPQDRVLNYIDYEYFANDAYKGITSQASIMNGYAHNQRYYSIICQGDSGGGDFYWDGTHWNLVGVHSWGPNPCGVTGGTYGDAFDVSADVRPFVDWIEKIVREDASATGCASLGPHYVCASRR